MPFCLNIELQAVRQVRSKARRRRRSMRSVVIETDDPTINSVAMEDTTALIGIVVAGLGVGMHQLTGSAVWDGVASLIIALAITNGMQRDMQQKLVGSTSHVNLLRIESDGIKNWQPLMDRLAKQPHVIAAAPAIYEQVLITRGPRARGAVLKGLIPKDEMRVSDLLKTVRSGLSTWWK